MMRRQTEYEYYIDPKCLDGLKRLKKLYYMTSDLRPMKQGVIPLIMSKTNLILLTREESKGLDLIPIIVKLLLISKNQDAIYLLDESVTSNKNKVSLPGGHTGYNEFASVLPDQEAFLETELIRELCEEMSVDGYSDYADSYYKNDLNNILLQKKIFPHKFLPLYYHWTDAFSIYYPVIINELDENTLSSKQLVKVTKADMEDMANLLSIKGDVGINVLKERYNTADVDIRLQYPDILYCIFGTKQLIK